MIERIPLEQEIAIRMTAEWEAHCRAKDLTEGVERRTWATVALDRYRERKARERNARECFAALAIAFVAAMITLGIAEMLGWL